MPKPLPEMDIVRPKPACENVTSALLGMETNPAEMDPVAGMLGRSIEDGRNASVLASACCVSFHWSGDTARGSTLLRGCTSTTIGVMYEITPTGNSPEAEFPF